MCITEHARCGAKFPPQEASQRKANCKWVGFQERTQCTCVNKADAVCVWGCFLRKHECIEKSHALNCCRHLLETHEIEAQEMMQNFC
jgi:hypothetical protein